MPHAVRESQVLVPAEFATTRVGHFGWLATPGPIAARIVSWLGRIGLG